MERLHSSVTEQLENADALQLPPVLAVRRNGDVFVVVKKSPVDTGIGPVREREVMSFHDLTCCGC